MEPTSLPQDAEMDSRRYRLLRDYLLLHKILVHVSLAAEDSEPFLVGDRFFGPTFEAAVDTLGS